MASSFTSIRDCRIKMSRVLGYYLVYNGSSTARYMWTHFCNGTHAIYNNIPGIKLRLIASFPEQGMKLHSQHTYLTVFHII